MQVILFNPAGRAIYLWNRRRRRRRVSNRVPCQSQHLTTIVGLRLPLLSTKNDRKHEIITSN